MVSVMYEIYKKSDGSLYDIIVTDDDHWLTTIYIKGGIRNIIEQTYPSNEYKIEVSYVVNP